MESLGVHVLADLMECHTDILLATTDEVMVLVQDTMLAAAREAKATIIGHNFRFRDDRGISGCVMIAESHLILHTYPETKCALVDVFTCGPVLQPGVAVLYLIEKFQSKRPLLTEFKRGTLYLPPGQTLLHKMVEK